MGYYTKPRDTKLKKLDNRAEKCILIGYAAKNQYRVWTLVKGRLETVRHVEFNEVDRSEIFTIQPSISANTEAPNSHATERLPEKRALDPEDFDLPPTKRTRSCKPTLYSLSLDIIEDPYVKLTIEEIQNKVVLLLARIDDRYLSTAPIRALLTSSEHTWKDSMEQTILVAADNTQETAEPLIYR